VLRGICGPKREKVARGWRRLHNVELHKLYMSPNVVALIKSRRRRWAGHIACMGETLIKKSEGKEQLRRPRRRWKDNIRLDLG